MGTPNSFPMIWVETRTILVPLDVDGVMRRERMDSGMFNRAGVKSFFEGEVVLMYELEREFVSRVCSAEADRCFFKECGD